MADEEWSVSNQPLSPLSFLLRSAEVWGDRPAVQDGAYVADFETHLRRVECAKAALVTEFGIRTGERVASLLPNAAALLELHYAAPGSGVVLVPMNTRLFRRLRLHPRSFGGVAGRGRRDLPAGARSWLGDARAGRAPGGLDRWRGCRVGVGRCCQFTVQAQRSV
jgi:hypothetical protein